LRSKYYLCYIFCSLLIHPVHRSLKNEWIGVVTKDEISISPTFFIQKCLAQLYSSYSLALKFFRISTQKLLVKCWWNWLKVSISSTINSSFCTNSFVPKNFKAKFWLEKSCAAQTSKNASVKYWLNWPQGSISPTFYARRSGKNTDDLTVFFINIIWTGFSMYIYTDLSVARTV